MANKLQADGAAELQVPGVVGRSRVGLTPALLSIDPCIRDLHVLFGARHRYGALKIHDHPATGSINLSSETLFLATPIYGIDRSIDHQHRREERKTLPRGRCLVYFPSSDLR